MLSIGALKPAIVGAACPRCGAPTDAAFEASDRNRAVTEERFQYRRCSACRVVWLADIPPDLADYYPGGYHEFPDSQALAAAVAREEPRLALITRHVRGGQLVEIGPSQGVFAAAARGAGFHVVALEMDEACCRHLENVVGVRAIQTVAPAEDLRALPPSDAIVMWHVIEHLPDPWTTLRAIADNLKTGGLLAIATPNPDSVQSRVFGAKWVHLDAPRHITLLPLRSLADEAQQLGLRLVSATTTDPAGLSLNRLGWERSILRPPALRSPVRLAHTVGRILTAVMQPWERRALRGAAYTVVFRKESLG